MEPLVSVVIPMHDEEENAAGTIAAASASLEAEAWSYEIVPVSDGSTDGTADVLEQVARQDARVRPIAYGANRGRGYALRQGFAHARGEFVVTLDADLSYSPEVAVAMIRTLQADPDLDMVLASPYMPGGAVDGVPLVRLALSRVGNVVLRRALPRPIWTSTGIARAYRARALRRLPLAADGKEIHLEILSGAMALGMRIAEVPAVLRARRKGRSKFRPKATVASHLLFSVLSRPADLLSYLGLLVLASGIAVGAYLFSVYLAGTLNPERPLMTIMLLLLIGGAILLSFSLLAAQIVELRKAVIRLHADVNESRARSGDAYRGSDTRS
ncbi:MAG: glycosyltransferase [Coriobacteriia bacterium]|nr:glycosyltransferase [Coriobacteriia bacterium]